MARQPAASDPWASSCFGEDEEPPTGAASPDAEDYLLPRQEVERLCDCRLDPPPDATSAAATAASAASSKSTTAAALRRRHRQLVRADSLVLRDPQARHAVDMLAAVRRLRQLQRRQLKRRRQRLLLQAQTGAAAPPPSPPAISPEEAARLRELLAVPAHTTDPRVPLLLGATSAEDCHRLLLCSSSATVLLAGFDNVSDAALRALAHSLDLFLTQLCQRIADQPRVSDYPDGLHKALADFGITEPSQLRRCYDRLFTGGRRRAQDRLAALLGQLAPQVPPAFVSGTTAALPAAVDVKVEANVVEASGAVE